MGKHPSPYQCYQILMKIPLRPDVPVNSNNNLKNQCFRSRKKPPHMLEPKKDPHCNAVLAPAHCASTTTH
jgi:hypothetical protein